MNDTTRLNWRSSTVSGRAPFLYEHDVVAPEVVRGTDIGTAGLRRALLEERTKSLNLARLLGGKRARNVRAKAPSKSSSRKKRKEALESRN